MINIDQLQAFVSAAAHGSYSAAARSLGKAQSAVSTAVINLETDTGVILFDRSGRNPVLTEEGSALLKHARSVLRSNLEFAARATSVSKGVETQLGIGHSLQIPVCSVDNPLAKVERVTHDDLRQHRQIVMTSRSLVGADPPREQKSPRVWFSESPYLIMDLGMSNLGWAELPWTTVAQKLKSGEMIRLQYDFQQSDMLQGVDVVWTKRRALGAGGEWLLKKLLNLDPGLWQSSQN